MDPGVSKENVGSLWISKNDFIPLALFIHFCIKKITQKERTELDKKKKKERRGEDTQKRRGEEGKERRKSRD